MIVAVSSAKGEADIIGGTIKHLHNQGIRHVIISTPPDDLTTREEIRRAGGTLQDQTGPFDQGAEITRLAHGAVAFHRDVDWIIPFDADEYWIDPLGGTVASVLNALPADCLKVHCAVFKHADWDHRYVTQNPMGKVAFRPTAEMVVAWGNHDVTLGQAGTEEHGLLEIRELQYRDYDHFLAKVHKARELFASWDVPPQHGYHMRVLADLPDEALPAAYLNVRDAGGDTIYDPIPTA